ncbi:MAG: lysophospholipid acyltransferase family protein [Ramlibacter sp.]
MLPLFRLLSLLPLRVLHAIGAVMGWVVFLSSPVYRRRFRENAQQAGLRFDQVRGAVAHTGRMAAELPRLWMGAVPPVEWVDAAGADAAYGHGTGVLFLTPHLGCFEATAVGVAQRYAPVHGPLTVLFRPARKAWLAPLVAASRQKPGLEPVPTTLAGVRQMIRALRHKRAVGLLPDQVPPDGMGVWAPFFGRPAYTMTLAARLVHQTGAHVLLVWGERLPAGRGFRLHCRELREPLSPDLETAITQLNDEMAGLIRECPQQYLWSYARYKAPRAQAA